MLLGPRGRPDAPVDTGPPNPAHHSLCFNHDELGRDGDVLPLPGQKRWAKTHRNVAPTEYSRELGWRLISGRQGVGEHGWRGPYRTTAKPDGRYRIVCLGDSTTHGYWCPWEDAWPCQLENLLNADAEWTSTHGVTEVLNFGVPGFGTDQELIALKSYGLSYKPDLVILHLCVNDFADVSYDHDWRMSAYVTRYKPFFALEEGQLVIKRDFAPLPRHHSGSLYKAGEGPSFGLRSALLPEVGRFSGNFRRRDRLG